MACRVDRTRVRVAYRVKDAAGSTLVQRPRAVTMRLTLGVLSIEAVACDTSLVLDSRQSHIAYCSLDSFPLSWFSTASTGTVAVAIALVDEAGSGEPRAVSTLRLTLAQQPAWFDAALRSSPPGTQRPLTAPVDLGLDHGGVFLSLPTSPVYAGESFDAYMYAHTGGYALSSMTVELHFSPFLLEFISYGQSADFNAAVFSQYNGRLAWVITGRAGTVPAEAVTGSAVFLVRVSMRFKAGTAPSTYAGSTLNLFPHARTLVNNGNLAFVEGGKGKVYSHLPTAQQSGSMAVRGVYEAGLFGAAPVPILFNAALLGGGARTYALTAAIVSSYDLSHTATTAAALLSCQVGHPSEPTAY